MQEEREYCELYDENHHSLGRSILRGEPVPEGAFIVAVGIWVINNRKEILLTKRSLEKRFAPGKWENTGGHLRAGESAEEAIVRELAEETGIRVEKEAIHYLGTAKVPPYLGDNYYVRMDVDLNDVRLQSGETSDAKWATLEELERMAKEEELAPSVWSHLMQYRDAFYAVFQ